MSHPLVQVAKQAIVAWSEGVDLDLSSFAAHAGEAKPVFVTLFSPDGSLRGCIGHLAKTQADMVAEVASTAVAAAAEDPRFPAVTPGELDGLSLEISVLEAPEPVTDLAALDPERWGVVVKSGHRRGVLLPALEGVDTVEQQLSIARRKAGIPEGVKLYVERFEVTKLR